VEKEALELIQSNQITTTFNISQFRGGQPQHDHDEVKQRTPQEISDRAGQGQGQGYSHIVDVDTRPDSISFTHVAICSSKESSPASLLSSSSSLEEVQESTSTLVAARALIKANRTDDAWSYLRSLFAMQGTNGFMPKYIYWNNQHHANHTHSTIIWRRRLTNIRTITTEHKFLKQRCFPLLILYQNDTPPALPH
jgi:hypothetical protein